MGLPPPYFQAFVSRLSTTCSMRPRSQRPVTDAGASSVTGHPAVASAAAERSSTSRTSATRSTGSQIASAKRPVEIRDTSRMSSTRRVSRSICRTSRGSVRASASGAKAERLPLASARSRCWTCIFSDVSGVLSSCEAIERNSSRARMARTSSVTSWKARTIAAAWSLVAGSDSPLASTGIGPAGDCHATICPSTFSPRAARTCGHWSRGSSLPCSSVRL